jgi:hypothetical protein
MSVSALASPPAHSVYSPLVQLMGMIGAPLGRKRWEATALDAGLRDAAGRPLAAPDVAAMLTEALACGHAEETPYGFRCAPQHAFAAFREAALVEGRLREWQRVVLAALDATAEPPASRWQLVGAMRFALCAPLHEQQRRVLLARHSPPIRTLPASRPSGSRLTSASRT